MPKLISLNLLLTFVLANQVFAQTDSPKIAFLHLKLDSNQVALISASLSPGVLKRLPEYRAAIDLEVATAAGKILWTNSVANPLLQRLEFEDPQHPGIILSKQVQFTNAEFTVRVPALPGAHRVNFYSPQPAAGTNTTQAAPSLANVPGSQKRLLGTVLLPGESK